MSTGLRRGILLGLLAGAGVTPLFAQYAPFSFEGIVDSTVLTNQYAGAIFGNAIVLSAGITLNEFEFPPHAGTNVASDNGGPMTITFTSALRSFAGYFTYSVPLTVQALDSSNHPIMSASSAFSNNQAISGVSGSHPNELIQVSSASDIYKIVITGGSQGASFTMDDTVVFTRCDLNVDGATNVADAQAMVNQALGVMSPTGDLNGDGLVNVVDVQMVINAALGQGCAAT